MKNKFLKISALSATLALLALPVLASPISSLDLERHAWNDVTGWIDFGKAGAVDVADTKLTGYATALQIGPVALDCGTTPNGDICAISDFKVANDGKGNLSGWAWNDAVGWISFNCSNQGTCATSDYKVVIDGSTGDFSGWAWNDAVGWISFNCINGGPGSCNSTPPPNASYKVNTSWRSGPAIPPPDGTGPTGIGPGTGGGGGGTSFDADTYLTSSVFDTQVKGGAALNTVMWLGDQPSGTSVGIQIASSNSASGPWVFVGPDGKSTSAYEANQGVQFRLNPNDHNNKRYFRYKAYLYWLSGKTPTVNDVVISYSP